MEEHNMKHFGESKINIQVRKAIFHNRKKTLSPRLLQIPFQIHTFYHQISWIPQNPENYPNITKMN